MTEAQDLGYEEAFRKVRGALGHSWDKASDAECLRQIEGLGRSCVIHVENNRFLFDEVAALRKRLLLLGVDVASAYRDTKPMAHSFADLHKQIRSCLELVVRSGCSPTCTDIQDGDSECNCGCEAANDLLNALNARK